MNVLTSSLMHSCKMLAMRCWQCMRQPGAAPPGLVRWAQALDSLCRGSPAMCAGLAATELPSVLGAWLRRQERFAFEDETLSAVLSCGLALYGAPQSCAPGLRREKDRLGLG